MLIVLKIARQQQDKPPKETRCVSRWRKPFTARFTSQIQQHKPDSIGRLNYAVIREIVKQLKGEWGIQNNVLELCASQLVNQIFDYSKQLGKWNNQLSIRI